MKTPVKLGAFVAALTATLALAFGVGQAVGPIDSAARDATHTENIEHTEDTDMSTGTTTTTTTNTNTTPTTTATAATKPGGHDGHAAPSTAKAAGADAAQALPGGLMVSQHGYTLSLDSTLLPSGRTTVGFQVTGPDGRPVTDYEPTHDKALHLIAVRRDLAGFQHVHPTLDAAGTWRADLNLTPGVWRFFTDFRPAGHGETLVLGRDASVAGGYEPGPLPAAARTAQVDGYTVTLDGALTPGSASELTLSVSRGGRPVTDLQPYLAAYGHLVALRSGDLAYLHVHPEGEPGDGRTAPGPDISFFATAPSAGDYRLFLDFQHDGVVRTAEFTVGAGATTPSDARPSSASPSQPPSQTQSPTPEPSGHDHP